MGVHPPILRNLGFVVSIIASRSGDRGPVVQTTNKPRMGERRKKNVVAPRQARSLPPDTLHSLVPQILDAAALGVVLAVL